MNPDETIKVELRKIEVIVLLNFLSKFNETPHDDSHEEQVLFNLECSLEKALPEILSQEWDLLTAAARRHLEAERG